MAYVSLLRTRPIAIETAAANEQHYEVGTGVLTACLGPRMKYSSALYPKGGETLAQAEIAMLESYGMFYPKRLLCQTIFTML
jgi:cation-transporting P-type ATPase 13A2